MDNIQKGNSGKLGKDMTPYEIIEKTLQAANSQEDPKRIYAALIQMTQQPNYRILRHNNSLLLLENNGNGTADCLLYTADNQKTVAKNIAEFAKALRVGQFKKATFAIPNLKFIDVVKASKVDYKVKQLGQGQFLVEIEL
jgi:hypothetical protein